MPNGRTRPENPKKLGRNAAIVAPEGTVPEASGLPPPPGVRVTRLAETASFALAWLTGVLYASPVVHFADDLAIVRSLGLPLGFEGLVSTGLGSLFQLLPLGSRPLRLAWAAALGLGVLSWLVFRIALACQAARRDQTPRLPNRPRLEALLALSAALSAALGPMFLLEGTSAGGHSVATALGLAALALGLGILRFGARTPLLLGALLAATAIESRWAAGATAAALAVALAMRPHLATRRAALGFALGAAALLSLPVLCALALRASATPEAGLALTGVGIASQSLAVVERSVGLGAWLSEVGLPWCALSLVGLGLGLFGRRTRLLIGPLSSLLALDASLGLSDLLPTQRDPQGAVRMLSVVVFATGGALGVRTAVDALGRAKIPFAPGAAVLLVMYSLTLALVATEDAARAIETREHSVAELWTDEAVGNLPPSAVLLIRSETLVLRWLAIQKSQGTRPDVLLVPMQLFERDTEHAPGLARNPGLLPLVRDMLLTGRPGEFALSQLADTRPLFVEPQANWDRRLLRHLAPRPFLSQFAPHPLGRSDRRLGLKEADRSFSRVSAALRKSPDGDPATRAVVAAELAHRASVLTALGDHEQARKVFQQLSELKPNRLQPPVELAPPSDRHRGKKNASPAPLQKPNFVL